MKGTTKTLLTVFVLLLDEIAIVAIVLFILWKLGINLPLWALIAMVVALVACTVILCKLIAPVSGKKQMTAREGMIGLKGKAITPLTPEGMIKVRGELWKASSIDSDVNVNEEVIVVGLERLKLLVKCQDDAQEQRLRNDALK